MLSVKIPTRIESPDGTNRNTVYNPFDTPLSSTDRLGRITNSTFDIKGNLLSRTRAATSSAETTETFIYNAKGLVTEHRDALYDANFPELHNTRYLYDSNNYPIKTIHSADKAGGTRPETTQTWDNVGRIATTTDALGRTVTYSYVLTLEI